MPDDQSPDDPIIQLEQVRRQRQTQETKSEVLSEFSDDALALRFAELHVDKLRYVAAWGKWLLWRGSHWKNDDTLRAFDLARVICRDASARATSPTLSAALASAKTTAAVVFLARSDRRLAETVDAWDCGQALLNAPQGTINLRRES
jgi:phage/plasmid-associated DNA primase